MVSQMQSAAKSRPSCSWPQTVLYDDSKTYSENSNEGRSENKQIANLLSEGIVCALDVSLQ